MKKAQKILIYTMLFSIWIFHSSFMSNTYLKAFVEGFNKTCPKQISANVRVDGAELLPDKIIKFNYTLVNINPILENYYSSKVYMSGIEVSHLKITHDESFSSLREMNVRFLFAYHNEEGTERFRQLIEPEQYNSIAEADIPQSEDEVIIRTLAAMKAQLPLTEPSSGVTVADLSFADSTLIATAIIPDKFVEEVLSNVELKIFEREQAITVAKMPNIQALIKKGYSVKYIYLKENTENLTTVIIRPSNIEKLLSEAESNKKERAQLVTYISSYTINRVKDDVASSDAVAIVGSYVSKDTLYTVLRLSDEFIEQSDPKSFYAASYPTIRNSFRGDPEISFLLHNGIKIGYLYNTTQGELFQAMVFNEEDIFGNNEQDLEEKEDQDNLTAEQIIARIQSLLPYENKEDGIYLNHCTLLDNVIYIKGKITKQLSKEEISEINADVEKGFKAMIEDTPPLKKIMLEGISFNISFTDEEGEDLIEIILSAEDFN